MRIPIEFWEYGSRYVYENLNRFKEKKATGSDRIPTEFYKYGTNELINKLKSTAI